MKMLGKRAPVFDRRTLRLSDYTAKLLPPPISAYYQAKISMWPMLLNDELGDCVPAAAGHMIQEWTEYAGKPVTPINSQILAAYEQIGGYNPADPLTDQGCDMLTALKVWRNSGIADHKIDAFVSLEPGNLQQLKLATYLFGNAYLGLALPLSAQDQAAGWFVDDSAGAGAAYGSWGGHCVPTVGYDNEGFTVVTWGALLNMSPNFYRRYCDEAYAILSSDWITATKITVNSIQGGDACNGFDFAQLKTDLADIVSRSSGR